VSSDDLFAGSGEMARLMRATDWAATPLGAASQWPQSLRTIVRVLLTSRFAMWMGWGPELTFFYNDAYGAMTLGKKHPWALGRPSREVWSEIWSDLKPRVDQVLGAGEATWDEDLLLFLERSGFSEETYHTFSYSPITDDGSVAGLLCVVSEETNRVIGDRRMALLRETATAIARTNTEAELFGALERVLATDARDLPFTLTYIFDEGDGVGRLASRTGIPADHAAAHPELAIRDLDGPWPIRDAIDAANGIVVEDLARRFESVPKGPWSRFAERALVLPIPQQGQHWPAGVFITGLNPFRPLDSAYQSFVGLLVGQIAAGVANVRAYTAERRRAEALAEIDRAKTTFFSNVSHEFRTPLTLLLGPLDDVLRAAGTLPSDVRDQVDVAYRNGLRLLKLVNTLLDFSRIEAGRARARFEPVDLGAITRDVASTFRSAIDKAGLTFTVRCDPLLEPAYVDRDMWEKIVLNLLSNAFKFTLSGTISVAVSRVESHAEMTIADTGAGIPERELDHVFDRFHRVAGTRGRSHEGSGIGLALVNELVKLHGGAISVTSEVGRGSRFTVSVPLGSAHLPSDQIVAATAETVGSAATAYVEEALSWLAGPGVSAANATSAAVDEELPSIDAPRVLLADDNPDMREYARRLLAERWTVDTASNGREALDAARVRHPDVIVTDVMMPELDGFGLLREIRADADLRTVPVIMLSARAGEEAQIEGLAASADDYLSKPFSARNLLARVDAQLMKVRARAIEERHARRMNTLFMHAPVAIAVVKGRDHVYEIVNERYRELAGRRDLVGRSVRDAFPELSGKGFFEILDSVFDSGQPYIGVSARVTLNTGVDGEQKELYADYVFQPLFDDDGMVDSVAMVAHDVTALANAKLEAESANRLKDEFLATLSHELRTPLNAVLGYIQMLRGGAITPDRVGPVLETIERNAKLQEQLISDVLDVSRIITGKLRLDVKPVDLGRVIQEALETVMPAATAKGIRLQSIIEHPEAPVAGDAQRLQQVVWNLLSNSVKFTPRGGRIQIRLARVDSHVEITVSDTGEGIAAEFLPHLFQRFRQADSAFTRAHGGLGLGLAISRHLVEAHGGRIDAASPGRGGGATLRVRLPLMIVHDETPAVVERAQTVITQAGASVLTLADLRGVRVLLVDDDVDALAMAKDVLTTAGATVVIASSADGATAALDREPFDVAILDIGMPGVDGYELLRRIRQRSSAQQRTIPAAALTAYARSADRTRSLQAGFQMHLSKPVEPTELAAAVLMLASNLKNQ
jgi:signal transduction histidine kinase/DNA-binding response OmpR family regulator